jgi:hypothetical protein
MEWYRTEYGTGVISAQVISYSIPSLSSASLLRMSLHLYLVLESPFDSRLRRDHRRPRSSFLASCRVVAKWSIRQLYATVSCVLERNIHSFKLLNLDSCDRRPSPNSQDRKTTQTMVKSGQITN